MLKLLLAGVLALPALLVAVVTAPIIALLSIPSLLLLVYRKQQKNGVVEPLPDHVVITGGSSGIGFCLAKECVEQGISQVTILARNQSKLDKAKKELEQLAATANTKFQGNSKKCIIRAISVSVSDYAALEKIAKEIIDPKDSVALFNVAGFCHPGYWDAVPPEQYLSMINTNQLGAMYTTRAFLNYMQCGRIVLCSSAAGQVGVFGYTGYSPTKYALRGFAEALHQELSTRPIHVQVVFPVDTDTEGYQQELALTPDETKAISEDAGLSKPEDVARSMFRAATAKHPSYLVYFTFEGWMLTNFTSGMSPVVGLFDAVTQVALAGIFRYISLFYLNNWWRILQQMAKEKAADKNQTIDNTATSTDDDDNNGIKKD
jgi:3-dehydrosphinganine reductase